MGSRERLRGEMRKYQMEVKGREGRLSEGEEQGR